MQILPGVSHQTGGWRILIRALIEPCSGKVGNRGAYGGRIGGGPDPGKGGSGRGFLERVYGVKIVNLRAGFSQIPAGKISGIFFVKFFGREKKI